MKTKINQLITEYHLKIQKEKMRLETAIALKFQTSVIQTRIDCYKEIIEELSELIK